VCVCPRTEHGVRFGRQLSLHNLASSGFESVSCLTLHKKCPGLRQMASAKTPAIATKAALQHDHAGASAPRPENPSPASARRRALGEQVRSLAIGKTQQDIAAACKGARPNHVGAVIARHKPAGRIEERDGKLYAGSPEVRARRCSAGRSALVPAALGVRSDSRDSPPTRGCVRTEDAREALQQRRPRILMAVPGRERAAPKLLYLYGGLRV
jgi:hypothetical protein